MKQIISLALILFAFASCKKDHTEIEFEGALTITAPAANDSIHGGNNFVITGTATGNTEMHGYMVKVFNQDTQAVIYENEHHDHTDSYTINETVTHTLTATTHLRAYIEVEADHDGGTMTKEVLFTYEP